jgi:hypothetical protein
MQQAIIPEKTGKRSHYNASNNRMQFNAIYIKQQLDSHAFGVNQTLNGWMLQRKRFLIEAIPLGPGKPV